MSHSFEHSAMATEFYLVIENETEEYAESASVQVFELIDSLEQKLSRFIPDSDISRINRMKPEEQMPIDFETWDVIKQAIEVSQLTHGAFDIGVARHLDIFRATKQGILNQYEASQALKKVQVEKHEASIFIDPEKPMVYCVKRGFQFDLGAIGKGYALDRVKLLMKELDIETFSMSAGDSTILVSNDKEVKAAWGFPIAAAEEKRQVSLDNHSVSASGTFYQGNHIFDPRTGKNDFSPQYQRVWVATQEASYSDAFATAFFLLEEDDISKLVESSKKIIWVAYSKDGNLHFLPENAIY